MKLVEAAKGLYSKIKNINTYKSLSGIATEVSLTIEGGMESVQQLKQALADLDAQAEPEVEYKWLAMDKNRVIKCTMRPIWWWNGQGFYTNQADNHVSEVDSTPSFLKPCQLWERGERQGACGSPRYADTGLQLRNGYWWRLVEDHSK